MALAPTDAGALCHHQHLWQVQPQLVRSLTSWPESRPSRPAVPLPLLIPLTGIRVHWSLFSPPNLPHSQARPVSWFWFWFGEEGGPGPAWGRPAGGPHLLTQPVDTPWRFRCIVVAGGASAPAMCRFSRAEQRLRIPPGAWVAEGKVRLGWAMSGGERFLSSTAQTKPFLSWKH